MFTQPIYLHKRTQLYIKDRQIDRFILYCIELLLPISARRYTALCAQIVILMPPLNNSKAAPNFFLKIYTYTQINIV